MLHCEWFTFASVPKTGCCWFRKALEASGIPLVPEGRQAQHTIAPVDNGRSSITIKRDPAEWLRSYFLRVTGRVDLPMIDLLCDLRHDKEETFEIFGWRYVHTMPGLIKRIFGKWKSDYTLRTESLAMDTVDLMSLLDVKCDLDVILSFKPDNVTPDKPAIPDDLRLAIEVAA